jgi:cellulose synthase/poly-beta-1,6-N-acetylglucosamine synthase-like glycosyltransferase
MLLSELRLAIGVALVLATLPLLVELLVLTMAALLPVARGRDQEVGLELPSLSILVPAHNEEALIGRCIRSLRASAGSGEDVLVIAHNCTDATAAVAEAAGARVLELDDSGQTGKGSALNYGFAVLLAEGSQAVLVVDADSVVDRGLVRAVRQRLATGARALQCRYEVYNSQDSARTKLTTLAIFAFNVIRPLGRAHLCLSAGVLGNGFALHRSVLMRIPYTAHSVVEDLEYHLALVRAGIRVEFIDTAAVRGEMPVTAKGARAQRARWEGGRQLMMRRWAPKLMADVLRGRLRQMEPLLDLLALPIASELILLMFAACLPVLWLRFYVLTAFAVLVFHLSVAAIRGPGFWSTLKASSTVPAYILWKLRIFPEIWRTSRANAAWVRAARETSADGQ